MTMRVVFGGEDRFRQTCMFAVVVTAKQMYARAGDRVRAIDLSASAAEEEECAVPSNAGICKAHSEGGVVGEMLQLNDHQQFGKRAVRRTARVSVRPEP